MAFTKVSAVDYKLQFCLSNCLVVSDVFHTGSPDSTLWEFKHGNGNFKRGDLVGLREIKRRASRHALVHRDSYPSVKPPPYTQPGTPAEPIQPVQETAETRLSHIEYTLHDMHGRLAERDSQIHQLLSRNHQLTEALVRSLQLSQDMTRAVSAVVNDPNHPAFRGRKKTLYLIPLLAVLTRSSCGYPSRI